MEWYNIVKNDKNSYKSQKCYINEKNISQINPLIELLFITMDFLLSYSACILKKQKTNAFMIKKIVYCVNITTIFKLFNIYFMQRNV